MCSLDFFDSFVYTDFSGVFPKDSFIKWDQSGLSKLGVSVLYLQSSFHDYDPSLTIIFWISSFIDSGFLNV